MDQKKKTAEQLWKCERLNPNKIRKEGGIADSVKHIPLGDKEQQRWLESRKVDQHLDNDFLPRNLVYNYGDFAESNEQI
jgi:hypothetical protein